MRGREKENEREGKERDTKKKSKKLTFM